MTSPLTHDDPRLLGGYRLLMRLGSGGMGTVYLGRSAGGRTVALKTMHPRIAADPEFRTRFRLEVDAARVIGGHHGASVVDADPMADTPWLATEYVLGPALDDAVALAGPLPERCVRALGAALCDALARLHQSDVVHRDLKPSNILLTAFGPKLIDFGIARAIGDERLTQTGAAAGTPAFMSPEQATGMEHPPAGDVFALAGVLTFALTDHGPFGSGQTADLLYRVRYAEPDLTGIDKDMRFVLERCLSKEPELRPGVEELRGLLHDGRGEFADHLPDVVLADIAQRCVDVWQPAPPRLSAPSEESDTGFPGEQQRRLSRRTVLATAGGGAFTVAAVGLGAWAYTGEDGGGGGADSPAEAPGTRPRNVPPKARWQSPVSDVSALSRPVVVGPSVISLSSGSLFALDIRSGERLWESADMTSQDYVATDGKKLFAVRQDVGDSLVLSEANLRTGGLGSVTAQVMGFSSLDAKMLTATSSSIYILAPVVPDKATKGNHGWKLVQVGRKSGKASWKTSVKGWDPSMSGSGIAGVTAGDRFLLIGAGRAAAYDARSGKSLWDVKLPKEKTDRAETMSPAQVAVSGSHFYVGSKDVLAVRLKDGGIDWRFGRWLEKGHSSVNDERRYGPPSLERGVLYVAEKERGLVALDAATGKLKWEEQSTGVPPQLRSAPIVGKKYVYVVVDSRRWISAVDLSTHTSAWVYNDPNGSVSPPSAVLDPRTRSVVIVGETNAAAIPLE